MTCAMIGTGSLSAYFSRQGIAQTPLLIKIPTKCVAQTELLSSFQIAPGSAFFITSFGRKYGSSTQRHADTSRVFKSFTGIT